ncbi:toll-like receptor 4 [Physella acuta]|uniref:toll-like receptor 4 n=1 Tax=Physella acuta TaxID=109671 RepID=UPI0027DAEAFF|nr:toll-like receptor 4 [Physella acuta]
MSTKLNTLTPTGPGDLMSTEPSIQMSMEPTSQMSTAPNNHMSTGPNIHMSTGSNDQMSTEPNIQMSTKPTSQMSTSLTHQMSTGSMHLTSTGPTKQMSTGPTTQPSTGLTTQPSTWPTIQQTTAKDLVPPPQPTHHQLTELLSTDGFEPQYLPEEPVSVDETHTDDPCTVTVHDLDVIFNCSGRHLNDLDDLRFPREITYLYLDHNKVDVVPKATFNHLENLRVLNLSYNRIQFIDPNAFDGLINLEILSLEFNQLSMSGKSLPPNIFSQLTNLKDLGLLQGNQSNTDQYPNDLFSPLINLEHLTLDTAGETLNFNKQFQNLTHLIRLELSGSVKVISETSFSNLQNLQELTISGLPNIQNFSRFSFSPLTRLRILKIARVYIGVRRILSLFAPFVNKTMRLIHLDSVYLNSSSDAAQILSKNETFLSGKMTKYLRKICVEEFVLHNGNIYNVKPEAFANAPVWDQCLKKFDLSFNPIVGTAFGFAHIIKLKRLESFIVSDVFRACYDSQPFKDFPVPVHKTEVDFSRDGEASKRKVRSLADDNTGNIFSTGSNLAFNSKNSKRSLPNFINKTNNFVLPIKTEEKRNRKFIVSLSTSLQKIVCKRFIASNNMRVDITFLNSQNIRLFDFEDSGFYDFTGSIVGLTGLETIILSGNYMANLAPTFFDSMTSVQKLAMSKCNLNVHFMSKSSGRIVANLATLKQLDWSQNSLVMLAPGTFSKNSQIEYLNLAKNKFKHFPFEIKNTPLLQKLDLRFNSIATIDSRYRDELDNLANKFGSFYLYLSGNILSCSCQNLPFLQWLRRTWVVLDNGGNYTCMSKDGTLTYTADYYSMDILWRMCWSQFFFSLSLIILCIIVIGFSCVFLITRNKNSIRSLALQLLAGFEIKSASDYKTGVFLGYADCEYQFPCTELKDYIEDSLGLSTYISHRDLLPSATVASAIVDAINASWRVVLVFSQSFIQDDEWSLFTIRSAMYSQTPANPERVIVLVLEELRHRLPSDLLGEVADDNIVVLRDWKLDADTRRKLSNLLQSSCVPRLGKYR